MMWGKAEDAGGLAPAKDDNDAAASSRHFYRRTCASLFANCSKGEIEP